MQDRGPRSWARAEHAPRNEHAPCKRPPSLPPHARRARSLLRRKACEGRIESTNILCVLLTVCVRLEFRDACMCAASGECVRASSYLKIATAGSHFGRSHVIPLRLASSRVLFEQNHVHVIVLWELAQALGESDKGWINEMNTGGQEGEGSQRKD